MIKLLVKNFAIAEFNELKNVLHRSINIYILDFLNANLKFLTFITLNPRGRTRLIFKRSVKTKHGKDLFRLNIKKEPAEKLSSK